MTTIVSRFESIAERYQDNVALITSKERLTYGDLNRFANQIANIILARTGPGNRPIVLFTDQSSAEHVAAVLGILKAGKILLPLNPHPQTLRWGMHSYTPGGYVDNLLKQLEVDLVLCDHPNWKMATSFSPKAVNIDLALSAPTSNPGIDIPPTSVATIIHTSGTTGTIPKAVVRTHAFESYATEIANDPPIGPGDRSTVFRLLVHDVLYPLLSGATLCAFNLGDSDKLGMWVAETGITVFRSAVTVFRMLQPGRYDTVRQVNIGAEMITGEDVRYCERVFPHAELIQRYACTEMSVMAHNGRALGDRRFTILEDETGRPGGEIAVDSKHMALGYLNDGQATMHRFLPSGDGTRRYLTGDRGTIVDGRLVVLGRMT